MSSTFVGYIDESGDDGFQFGRGSSDWFVLSCVVTKRAEDLETVKLVDAIRKQLGKPARKPLHFRDLRHEHRLPYIEAIAAASIRTVSVLIHKPSLREPEKFGGRHRLYFYAARYLLERVSWYCRDHRPPGDAGDGTIAIGVSTRSSLLYDELRDYLKHLRSHTGLFDVRIDWETVRESQIKAFSAGRRMGLQIADAVASAFWYAVNRSQYGFVEDRYARMLKPVVYKYKGRYLGYGLKFWPREVDELIQTAEEYGWVRSVYK